ncbi:hypothetical protein [Mycolicibacterium mucogenicum]|uniref:Uncharacterized protein n=1 Tax=Mycolicibacterium mucogenicum DSM 44124 TaxID=1226753 RepID=A0A8E4R783_MYCMU|nr:hypothetical protein [Mycolicibacterium mucogenicum]KAB7752869.1 hypothetical protein MMUC44124_26400 [Mycolicibacterium mucogenicum DSM 44124]QPG69074.1 hypothetical protein C1S78_027425 [Mycolicibacterium mucogenicum DSM 44124]
MRQLAAIAGGILAGLALFAGSFGIWMVFGADPHQDPLLSPVKWRFRQ